MKKICILLTVLLIITLTGCAETNSEANIYVDKTIEAIEMSEFEVALKYAKTAVQKGNENPEFEKILSLLEQYNDVVNWVNKGRVMKAEEIYDEITGYEDTVLESAIDQLEELIDDEEDQIKEEIKTLQKSVEEERFYTAEKEADELLLKDLTEAQKDKVLDLWLEAVTGQKKTSPSPTKTPTPAPTVTPAGAEINITPEQAEQFARNALQLSANAVVTVTLQGEYYLVNATTDYGDYQDEVGCKVHVGDGTIYDVAG